MSETTVKPIKAEVTEKAIIEAAKLISKSIDSINAIDNDIAKAEAQAKKISEEMAAAVQEENESKYAMKHKEYNDILTRIDFLKASREAKASKSNNDEILRDTASKVNAYRNSVCKEAEAYVYEKIEEIIAYCVAETNKVKDISEKTHDLYAIAGALDKYEKEASVSFFISHLDFGLRNFINKNIIDPYCYRTKQKSEDKMFMSF